MAAAEAGQMFAQLVMWPASFALCHIAHGMPYKLQGGGAQGLAGLAALCARPLGPAAGLCHHSRGAPSDPLTYGSHHTMMVELCLQCGIPQSGQFLSLKHGSHMRVFTISEPVMSAGCCDNGKNQSGKLQRLYV